MIFTGLESSQVAAECSTAGGALRAKSVRLTYSSMLRNAVYKHVSCHRCDLVIAATCSGCWGPFDLDIARLVPHEVLSLSWLCK